MWLSSWLGKRQGAALRGRSHGSSRKRPSCRLQLDALEDRCLPSTLTVLNNLDSGPASLRAAIATASPGDTIVFAPRLSGQTVTLGSQLSISKSLDIEGPGAARLTISGNNASRVFDIQGGATVTIAGLTIANGRVVDDSGGGIENEAAATLNFKNDVVINNTAYGVGGGLWNQIGATVTISNSLFAGNNAFGSLTFSYPEEGFSLGGGTTEGGAVDTDGTATVSKSTFIGNLAQGITGSDGTGGGAKAGAISTDGPLTVTGCVFTGNQARAGDGGPGEAGTDGGNGGQAEGGAIAIGVPTTVAIVSASVFTNNQALGGNGGTGGTAANGGSGGSGAAGGLSLADATLTLTNCAFAGNQATGGVGGTGGNGGNGGHGGTARGGAFVHTVTFGTSTPLSHLSEVTMWGNRATGGAGGAGGIGGSGGNGGNGQGGGIRALLGTINVSHSLLSGNQALGGKGGAAGAGSSAGGNGGNGQGGGLLTAFGVSAVFSDTALFLNQATGGAGAAGGNGGNGLGGGIFNGGPSPFGTPDLSLLDCLVALNQADAGAAGAGGSAGQGVGGGVYNLGTLSFDLATVIALNHASTSNNDIFP
jgi:hypothetical protein